MKVNCHCHIFSFDCVPLEFRERFFLNVTNPVHGFVHRLIHTILPQDSKIEGFLEFVDMSISEIAQMLVGEMDEAGIEIKRLTEDNPKEFLGLKNGVTS